MTASVRAPGRLLDRVEVGHRGADAASCYGTWRNVLVCIGHTAPSVQEITNYRGHLSRLVERHGKIGLITLLGDKTTPQPEAREALLEIFKSYSAEIAFGSFVMRAAGFSAATQRSLATAFILASGRRHQYRISSTPQAGIEQLVKVLYPEQKKQLVIPLMHALQRYETQAERWFGQTAP